MGNARTTQVAAEFLIEPIPNARTTQVAAEWLIAPPAPNAITTQLAAEWLIAPVSGDPCAQPWTMPTPNPYPAPSEGGPQYIYFDEIAPEWNPFGQKMGDGNPRFATIQTAGVRRFVFEYAGLDVTQANQLDAHYESTRGRLGFTLRHPRTGEILTGVRYEEYSRNPHQKLWSQTRSVKLVRYPV